jgi:hypothetical protein
MGINYKSMDKKKRVTLAEGGSYMPQEGASSHVVGAIGLLTVCHL